MALREPEILELIAKIFQRPIGEIHRGSLLIEVAKDSMDVMEFIAILQHQYGIALDAMAFVSMKTVGEVVDAILEKKNI